MKNIFDSFKHSKETIKKAAVVGTATILSALPSKEAKGQTMESQNGKMDPNEIFASNFTPTNDEKEAVNLAAYGEEKNIDAERKELTERRANLEKDVAEAKAEYKTIVDKYHDALRSAEKYLEAHGNGKDADKLKDAEGLNTVVEMLVQEQLDNGEHDSKMIVRRVLDGMLLGSPLKKDKDEKYVEIASTMQTIIGSNEIGATLLTNQEHQAGYKQTEDMRTRGAIVNAYEDMANYQLVIKNLEREIRNMNDLIAAL